MVNSYGPVFDYLGEPTPFNSDASVLLNHSAAMTEEELAKQREELNKIERNRPTSRSIISVLSIWLVSRKTAITYIRRVGCQIRRWYISFHIGIFPDRVGKVTPVFCI